jgi:hypothetical protein
METITNDCRAWSRARDQSRQGGFNDVRHAKVPYVAKIPDVGPQKYAPPTILTRPWLGKPAG